MATSPFTLAALATSAVPDLAATSVRTHTSHENGAFEAAVITTDEGDVIVRIPNTGAAEVRQSAEILGQAALTSGARTFLPFLVPETLGMTRADDTRAVVSTLLPGGKFHVSDLSADAIVLQSIGEAISAIHELPQATVQQSGLPIRSAENCRIETARLVDRAVQTRLLPKLVQERWISALQDKTSWDFAPVVVHGDLSDDHLMIEDDTVVGVLGFDQLSVGDPAADLAWLVGAPEGVLDQVLRYYSGGSAQENVHLVKRATLLHEIEIGQWLLYGVEHHDDHIVNDAVAMLDRLVDRITREQHEVESPPPVTAEGVADMLDETPEITQMRSDTEAYEGWDDERVFNVDADFTDTGTVELDDSADSQKTEQVTLEEPPTDTDELGLDGSDGFDTEQLESPTTAHKDIEGSQEFDLPDSETDDESQPSDNQS